MIQLSEHDYNASEGSFIIRIEDDYIMGLGICLGENDSISDDYEREYTEEEFNDFYTKLMRSEVINIHRDVIYTPSGMRYRGNVTTIQELYNITNASQGDIYKVIYDSNDDGSYLLDDSNNPVIINALYIWEEPDNITTSLENYQSGWVNISNSNRSILNREI